MGAKLYVGNLSYSVTEERLQQHFAQHGSVVSARIITDFNGTDFESRNIVVSEARPQQPRGPREGGGGGRPPRRDRY